MAATHQVSHNVLAVEPEHPGQDPRPAVLVIDAGTHDRALTVSILVARGYLVAEASDGAAGLVRARQRHPDLVILGVSSKAAGGFGDCEALRAELELEHLPILAIADKEDLNTIEGAIKAGASDILAKPINAALLDFRVRRLLEAHAIECDLRQAKDKADDAFEIITLLSRTLEQQVEHRTAQLTATRDKLLEKERELRQSQKMDALGQMAGGMAHELNNQLTVMSGFGRAALDRIENRERVRDCLNEVIAAVDRAAALTAQMLLFSRDQVVSPKVMHIGEAVEGMRAVLRTAVGGRVDLVLDSSDREAIAKADPVQLSQALLNLAVNAHDAMPQGGRMTVLCDTVVLGTDTRMSHHAGTVEPGRYVRLAVKDTGMGMDPATLERIFDPFFTTKEIGKGTGLGLSVVFGIVEQCGGMIDVESALGMGTTISLYYPISHEAMTPEETYEPSQFGDGGGTILVVEDEPAVLIFVSMTLRDAGYDVLPAHDGLEAIDVMREAGQDIDLFITDVVMPGLGGIDLAAIFEKECPGKPVLFISGHAPELDETLAHLGGISGFLSKPFKPWQLIEKVCQTLNMRVLGPASR